jgi:hypothetical protein
MDFEQSALKSQCQEDCSLIHEQFDDVCVRKNNPAEGLNLLVEAMEQAVNEEQAIGY